MKQHHYVSRYLWFVLGVLVNSFGVALITQAALGTSPISSIPYVLSLRFPITLGEFTFILNLVYILGQIVLLRRAFQPIQLLADRGQRHLQRFHRREHEPAVLAAARPTSWSSLSRSFWAAPSWASASVSRVAPDVLVVPGEGIVRAMTQVSGKRFGSVKVFFDCTLVAIALILSFLFFHGLNGLGLGTVISALIIAALSISTTAICR